MTFTNIELNVYNGLQDTPTQAEMCILVLYSQAISHPYMSVVWGPEQTNALDLGPLHKQVKVHIQKIIDNPLLLLHPGASYSSGAMDGKQWEHPEAMYAVWQLAAEPGFPDLAELLPTFFQGALDTWERFTKEFHEDGPIAKASAQNRWLAYMRPTNDANEGALGGFR